MKTITDLSSVMGGISGAPPDFSGADQLMRELPTMNPKNFKTNTPMVEPSTPAGPRPAPMPIPENSPDRSWERGLPDMFKAMGM